jgi:predicted metal-dependent hydrolase
MATQIELAGILLDVVKKDIKNIHLSVYPPTGTVRISAPLRMSVDAIRLFAISKLAWIKQQQTILREQERESPREYLDRESHYVWGRRYLLKVVEEDAAPGVRLQHSKLILRMRAGSQESLRAAVLADWYRRILKVEAAARIVEWQRRLNVQVDQFYVQQMKTRWGSCNPIAGTIRLNTELAKKPKECLDYIVLHEMIHLLDSTHGPGFVAMMDRFMPAWRETRNLLNILPARHEQWDY